MATFRILKLGIFQKLLVIMLVMTLLPLTIIWYAEKQNAETLINEHVDQRLTITAEALSNFADSWVEMNVKMLAQNAVLPNITRMSQDSQKPILETIVNKYDWIYLAHTLALNGENVSRSDDVPLKNYVDRSYLRQVLGGKALGQQVVIGKTSGKPALVLAVPIHKEGLHPKGILAIAMTLKELSNKIGSAKIGATGYAFLLDQDGKVIAHPNPEYTNKRKDLSKHTAYQSIVSRGQHRAEYKDENGQAVIGYMSRTQHGWILVVQQNRSEAYAAIEESDLQGKIMLLITFVLALIIASVLAISLTRPIRRLTLAAEGISRGDFSNEVIDAGRKDELGDLARTIERLGASIRVAMERFKA